MPQDTRARSTTTPAGSRPNRPAKPYPTFPLFAHLNGQWAKKIRGRLVFFGPWRDPYSALDRYIAQKDELHAGLVSRGSARARGVVAAATAASGATSTPDTEVVLIKDVANVFLTAKKRQMESGELSLRAFSDYHGICKRLVDYLGAHRRVDDITVGDFGLLRQRMSEGRGPVTLASEIQRVRTVFKHAHESGLLSAPVRFGTEFKKPSKRTMRQARQARGPRVFEPDEISKVLPECGVQMRAMVLLGLNCGFGNTDVAGLPREAVDLEAGVIDHARNKTAIPRRATLWPETVEALREVESQRPAPREPSDASLVFITKYGHRWLRMKEPGPRANKETQAVRVDAVALEFRKALRSAGIEGRGRGFYGLRHTFRTVADEIGDRSAIDLIMGHQNGSDVSTHYVERVSDERIRRVTDHVLRTLLD